MMHFMKFLSQIQLCLPPPTPPLVATNTGNSVTAILQTLSCPLHRTLSLYDLETWRRASGLSWPHLSRLMWMG